MLWWVCLFCCCCLCSGCELGVLCILLVVLKCIGWIMCGW